MIELVDPRDVPLGGPRAMRVRRTLPTRDRSLIGAWCFLDHYGPDDVAETGGMSVAPHPHTGLQTVSWLFEGEIEHADSAGHHAVVRPGELNLMTAGRGISHSEVSTSATTLLHGAQLWVALPSEHRDDQPDFTHYAPEPVVGEGYAARVFLGSLLGSTSPVTTATPLLGVELMISADTELDLDVDAGWEHGVLVDTGVVSLGGEEVRQDQLAYLPPGSQRISLDAHTDVRVLLLGGPPFEEPVVMWWNFLGSSHEEIEGFRAEWMAQLEDGAYADGRFGVPVDNTMEPIPAPPLPNATLKPRHSGPPGGPFNGNEPEAVS